MDGDRTDGAGGDSGGPVASNSSRSNHIVTHFSSKRDTSVAPILNFCAPLGRGSPCGLPARRSSSGAPTNQSVEIFMAPAVMARKKSPPCLAHCPCQIWTSSWVWILEIDLSLTYSRVVASPSWNIWMEVTSGRVDV